MNTSDIQLAKQAALDAGRLLRERRAQWNNITAEFAHDLKLQADREAERVIIGLLRAHSPYAILTEETGEIGAATTPYAANAMRWIVDPLDGTVNYATGTPLSAVSIGLWHGPTPLYGVIHDFWRDELFYGGPDHGAFLNDCPIHVNAGAAPERAVLATGFPNARDFGDGALMRFMRSIQNFRKVRLLGTAALSLAYVACGRVDVYVEDDIMLWDAAAGAALVAGAGGIATILDSPRAPNACRARVAAHPALLAPVEQT